MHTGATELGTYEVFDERFRPLPNGHAGLEIHHQGCRWAEGPTYVAAGRYLVWSDIPNDRMLRLDETTGHVGVFRQPAGFTNGHTLDRQGRLVSCEQGNRRVTRTEHDGSITILADRFQGRRFNSPNDVVVASTGSIWFTDPPYGITSDYEGHRADPELDGCHVYRIDPDGTVARVADDFDRPNGLAFSLDERQLFISDSGAPKHMRVFDVADNSLSGGRVFATCTEGAFDGFRFDALGRIWTSARDGVHCYHSDGTLLGKILVPEQVANVVFGGPRNNRLYICATTSLYSVLLPVRGAPGVWASR